MKVLAHTTGGPFFEDLRHGDVLRAPPVTITEGLIAAHQAAVGNRSAATLDTGIARAMFGDCVAPPALAVDCAIGGSSVFTRRVRANLFYRGLQLRRLPAVGDTLRTSAEVIALKQNRSRPGRDATGLAVLRILTVDDGGSSVLDFERCAMVPLRDPRGISGHADDVTVGRPDVDVDALVALAGAWDLAPLREQVDGPYAEHLRTGDTWTVEDADVVTGATEFARLTLNVAAVHHDRRATGTGERLVYGGHTIGLAALQASRTLPALAMVLAWHRCDHIGPVREGDDLTSKVALEHLTPLVRGGALAHLRSRVLAHRDGESCGVLDWRYVALMA